MNGCNSFDYAKSLVCRSPKINPYYYLLLLEFHSFDKTPEEHLICDRTYGNIFRH